MGYGDIQSSRIWFVGIEPGGGWHKFVRDQAELSMDGETLLYDPKIPTRTPEGKTNPVWRRCQYISSQVLGEEPTFFMSNMAPLPRPSESHQHAVISPRSSH